MYLLSLNVNRRLISCSPEGASVGGLAAASVDGKEVEADLELARSFQVDAEVGSWNKVQAIAGIVGEARVVPATSCCSATPLTLHLKHPSTYKIRSNLR